MDSICIFHFDEPIVNHVNPISKSQHITLIENIFVSLLVDYPCDLKAIGFIEDPEYEFVGQEDLLLRQRYTKEAIIQILTDPNSTLRNNIPVILMTWRKFIDYDELFKLLWSRFNTIKPDVCVDFEKWKRAHLDLIRRNVILFIRLWIKYYFEPDFKCVTQLEEILNKMRLLRGCQKFVLEIECDILKEIKKSKPGKKIVLFNELPPKMIIPKSLHSSIFKDHLLLWHPKEIARQVTLIDSLDFCAIKHYELIDMAWSKSRREQKAPNICKTVARFNRIANWVTWAILQENDINVRVKCIEFMIDLGDELYTLKNFAGLFAIVSGIRDCTVVRLKKTWSNLSQKSQERYEEILKVGTLGMGLRSLYQTCLQALCETTTPCVPYIGGYLNQLTFIEEGSTHYTDKKFSMATCIHLEKTISEIIHFQNRTYNLEKCEELYTILDQLVKNTYDDKVMYTLSLELEPRVKK